MKKPKTAQIKPELRKYLIEHQKLLEADGKVGISEANEINRALLNQLFVMAGGLITLASPIFIDRGILISLSPSMRQALVDTIVLAVLSIFFGFVQLFRERLFISKSAGKKFSAADAIGRGKVKTGHALRLLLSKIKPSSNGSSDLFTGLQFVCLGVASVQYVAVMAHVLSTLK